MKVLAPEMQVFMEYLQERKLKLTPHRQLILEIFLGNEGHRSVEDIYRVVREKDPRVGYTTVYRTMKILADCGLAREMIWPMASRATNISTITNTTIT
jgi:Fur family ferric uptake transcriptional regulator